jgi:type II secretory pathway pseudopilin PulG
MQNQNGRSMIEMLGVLAIIGVLSVGGIAGYSKAMEKFKINKTIEQISTIANNVRTTFMSQGNYRGLDELIAHNAGIIPDEMWDEDNGAHNVWGEQLIIFNTSADSSNDGSAFGINTTISIDSACIELLTHDWSVGGQPVLVNAYTESNYNGDGWDLFAVSPVSPAKASYMCEKTKGENRGIYLYYGMSFNSNHVQDLLNGCGNEDGNCI